jgi:hypothetical protein
MKMTKNKFGDKGLYGGAVGKDWDTNTKEVLLG